MIIEWNRLHRWVAAAYSGPLSPPNSVRQVRGPSLSVGRIYDPALHKRNNGGGGKKEPAFQLLIKQREEQTRRSPHILAGPLARWTTRPGELSPPAGVDSAFGSAPEHLYDTNEEAGRLGVTEREQEVLKECRK